MDRKLLLSIMDKMGLEHSKKIDVDTAKRKIQRNMDKATTAELTDEEKKALVEINAAPTTEKPGKKADKKTAEKTSDKNTGEKPGKKADKKTAEKKQVNKNGSKPEKKAEKKAAEKTSDKKSSGAAKPEKAGKKRTQITTICRLLKKTKTPISRADFLDQAINTYTEKTGKKAKRREMAFQLKRALIVLEEFGIMAHDKKTILGPVEMEGEGQ